MFLNGEAGSEGGNAFNLGVAAGLRADIENRMFQWVQLNDDQKAWVAYYDIKMVRILDKEFAMEYMGERVDNMIRDKLQLLLQLKEEILNVKSQDPRSKSLVTGLDVSDLDLKNFGGKKEEQMEIYDVDDDALEIIGEGAAAQGTPVG